MVKGGGANQKFVSGEMETCLLSHYLLHTRAQRCVSIAQLEHALQLKKGKADLHWTAERLAKLAPGYDGLGNQGFADTSTSHPYSNAMKTPNFLERRNQFTYAETIGTKDLCQVR